MKKQSNQSKPNMYIQTVSANIEEFGNQNVYDSRKNSSKKFSHKTIEKVVEKPKKNTVQIPAQNPEEKVVEIDRTVDSNLLKKIESLIIQYEEKNPILCNVIYNEMDSVVGYPKELTKDTLLVEKSEELTVEISLYDIVDISPFMI